jgi:hypothetical protein
MQLNLGDGTTNWAFLDPDAVHGRGRVAPRLAFQFRARTSRERMDVQIHFMHGELMLGEERLGQGTLTGVHLAPTEYQETLEIPVSRVALDYIDSQAEGTSIEVDLRLSGWLRLRDLNDDAPAFASRPAPGEWTFESFGHARDTRLRYQIARSDWFAKVLEPIGSEEYICVEVVLPRADHDLRHAANHLRDAERAFREGNDAQVFLSCRGAVEALPGAPMNVFDGLQSSQKREKLDALLRAGGSYFHLGRHTADEGPRAGEFAVDHADAGFALNLAKLLVAETSRVLRNPRDSTPRPPRTLAEYEKRRPTNCSPSTSAVPKSGRIL